jgi:hypothetical protein
MKRGESWSTSCQIVKLHERSVRAWAFRSALWKKAFDWVERCEQVNSMLLKMGTTGKIPGAAVVSLDGKSRRAPTPSAWVDKGNWILGRPEKSFDAGDAALSPRGALCLPVDFVSSCCNIVAGCPGITVDQATSMLVGAKLPGEAWKAFARRHDWKPKSDGKINREEARRLATIAYPNAREAEVEGWANVIYNTLNRRSNNKPKSETNTRRVH